MLHLAGPSIPSIGAVLAIYRQPWRLALLGRAAASTLLSALTGLSVGALLGTLVAFVAHLIRPMRRGLDRLAVMINAVPAVALGPILIVTVGRDWTPSTLSSIPVFFLTFVTVSSGLRSVNPRLNDVFSTLGAGRFSRLIHLELPAAIPSFLAGLRVSVSAAIVGAIVGEWFGSSTGLGIIILNTMLNFQIPLMWAAVVFAVMASLIAYGVIGSLERRARRHFS
jgi:NitT/TauT family transport system permease protein